MTLTNRERDIIQLLAKGFVQKEVADHLHISVQTVKAHLTNARGRNGARTTIALVMAARESGMMGHGFTWAWSGLGNGHS
jgi:DNA-binding NarL/FixJ family response regulator